MGSRVWGAGIAMALLLWAGIVSVQATAAPPERSGPTATSASVSPPEVIIDVTRSLGIVPFSVTLDSVHFARPMLLIGTDTGTTGQSFVFVVDPADLAIVDTVIALQSRIMVVTAGHVDADLRLDYLVGMDSSVVLLAGAEDATPETYRMTVTFPIRPYDSLSPTATVTGTIRDLTIDDRSGSFWVSYYTDVTYHPWPMEEIRQSKGGLRYFESPTADGVDLMSSSVVADFAFASDSTAALPAGLVFWYSIYETETHGIGSEPRSRAFGYRVLGDSSYSVSLAGVFQADGGVSLSIRIPDRLADFAGTGSPCFAYSYASGSWGPGNPGTYATATAVWNIATKSPLWSLPLWGTSRAWELDGDEAPDVLLFGASQTLGLKGNTGAGLFSVARDAIPFPVVSGTLLEEGVQYGMAIVLDTLKVFHLVVESTGLQSPVLPEGFDLLNAPNPFNASTEILYSLSSAATTRLMIYDVLGKRVRLLKQANEPAGSYRVSWDGIDDKGRAVGSGVYFYQLMANEHAVSRKMLLLK